MSTYRVKYVDRPNSEQVGDDSRLLPVIVGKKNQEYSPFLVLANSLLLMGGGFQLPSFGAEIVSKDDLVNQFAMYLLSQGDAGTQYFSEVENFATIKEEATKEGDLDIAKALGVGVMKGAEFGKNNKSYRRLANSFDEGQINIVCYEGRARTVIKRGGELYALVTEGRKDANVVLERFDHVSRKERKTYDSRFRPVKPTQPLRSFASANSDSKKPAAPAERRVWNTELIVALELRGNYMMNTYVNTDYGGDIEEAEWERAENWDFYIMRGSNPIRELTRIGVDICDPRDLPRDGQSGEDATIHKDCLNVCERIMSGEEGLLPSYLYETAKDMARNDDSFMREEEKVLLQSIMFEYGLELEMPPRDERKRSLQLLRRDAQLTVSDISSSIPSVMSAMFSLCSLAEKRNVDAVYLLGVLACYVADEPSLGAVMFRIGTKYLYDARCMYELSFLAPNTRSDAFESVQQQYLIRASQRGHVPATLGLLSGKVDVYKQVAKKHNIHGKISRYIQHHCMFADELCALAAHPYYDDKRELCSNPMCCRWAFRRTANTVQWLEGEGKRRTKQINPSIVEQTVDRVCKAFGFILYKDREESQSAAENVDLQNSNNPRRKEIRPNVRVKSFFRCCKQKYCSRACQLVDYHQYGHKGACRRLN